MNIKQEVAERIKNLLQIELNKCNNKIHNNLFQFKKLQEEQTILKRERVALAKLIKDGGFK
jgi:hypothetical protein